MEILKHELRHGRLALAIWTACIGILLAVCVALFPEVKTQAASLGDAFASMGSFSDAFGMNTLDFGTLVGFYAIECGNVLGLGGALYAALCAASILSKEERDKTGELLLTAPVSRPRIVTEKLAAVFIQVSALNLIVYALSLATIAAIGENIPWQEINLLHAAYYFNQLELAGICFAISAALRKGSAGAGLGIAITSYFMNLIANIAEPAEFLKFISPFGYCDGADIISAGSLDLQLLGIGAIITFACIGATYAIYIHKDIHSA